MGRPVDHGWWFESVLNSFESMPHLEQKGLKSVKEIHFDRGCHVLPPTFEAKTDTSWKHHPSIQCWHRTINQLIHDISVDLSSGLPQHRPLCASLSVPQVNFVRNIWKMPSPLTLKQKELLGKQQEPEQVICENSIASWSLRVEMHWQEVLKTSPHPWGQIRLEEVRNSRRSKLISSGPLNKLVKVILIYDDRHFTVTKQTWNNKKTF